MESFEGRGGALCIDCMSEVLCWGVFKDEQDRKKLMLPLRELHSATGLLHVSVQSNSF